MYHNNRHYYKVKKNNAPNEMKNKRNFGPKNCAGKSKYSIN